MKKTMAKQSMGGQEKAKAMTQKKAMAKKKVASKAAGMAKKGVGG